MRGPKLLMPISHKTFTFIDWFEILAFFGLFMAVAPILGKYIGNVLDGKKTLLHPTFGRLEDWTYRFVKIDPTVEMSLWDYGKTLLCFCLISLVSVFSVLLLQGYLPLNPQGFEGLSWDQALNGAVSYMTGTNWQPLPPETHLSYAAHLLGPTLQSFFRGAIGLSVMATLARGFSRNKETTLGNFFVDLIRSIVYIFLPLALVIAICLIIQGVIQSFDPYVVATTLEGKEQVIPQGPAATEIAIAQLSGSGGGFFNVERAHPLENPSALSNFLECFSMLLIPGAIPFAFGTLVKAKGRGLWIFAVMFALWILGYCLILFPDYQALEALNIDALVEGKEARIGIANSGTWLSISSATGNGSQNASLAHETSSARAVSLFNMLTGSVVYGAPGLGMCSLFLLIGLTVFLAGLLVGRTPEYLGKQLEWREIWWITLGRLIPNILILLVTSFLVSRLAAGHSPIEFTELAYAAASLIRLNGDSFGVTNFDTPFYNIATAALMLTGWGVAIFPILAVAGKMVKKRIYPETSLEFAILNRRLAFFLFFIVIGLTFIVFAPLLLMGSVAEILLQLKGAA